MQITVSVNGTEYVREVEARLLLIHFLRDDLGLTGSHWGCDTSNCGACVVWLDETPVKSCTVLAVMADGHRVRTVEGLAMKGASEGGMGRRAGGAVGSSTRSSRASPSATGCSAGSARRE